MEVRKKRRLTWLWFPVGALLELIALYLYSMFIAQPPNWLFVSLNVMWGGAYIVLRLLASRIECWKCHYVTMLSLGPERTKCAHCGAHYKK